MVRSLEETNHEKAEFFLALFEKAKDAYIQDDYVPVKSMDGINDSMQALCDHMDIEMVRIGFELGRQFERLGVVI